MSKEKRKIGIITEDQSKEERVEALKKVARKLEEIDGIENALLDDWTRDGTSGVIFATCENNGKTRTYERPTTFDITANLRSVGQLITNTLDELAEEVVITQYRITSKPENVYPDSNFSEESLGHDQKWYEIDVWTY